MGWWEDRPGPTDRRERDEFVEVGWDEVLDRLAGELARYRPDEVYGGSYGWASAGRFHHAQSQVHRFLNHAVGGYVRSVGDYSGAAAQTVLRHVLGPSEVVSKGTVTWDQVAAHTDTLLAFGGMNLKISAVGGGGISAHVERGAMAAAARRGAVFVNVSPLRSDLPDGSRWLSVPPGSDTALMLGLLHSTTTTAPARDTRTSGSRTGRAATRSTTTRTSAGCRGPSGGSTPSSCMSRRGPRPPGTRTSCCPRPGPSSTRTSAPARSTPS